MYGVPMGVIGGHLYEVLEVYGGQGVVYLRFGKCVGALGGHSGSFI